MLTRLWAKSALAGLPRTVLIELTGYGNIPGELQSTHFHEFPADRLLHLSGDGRGSILAAVRSFDPDLIVYHPVHLERPDFARYAVDLIREFRKPWIVFLSEDWAEKLRNADPAEIDSIVRQSRALINGAADRFAGSDALAVEFKSRYRVPFKAFGAGVAADGGLSRKRFTEALTLAAGQPSSRLPIGRLAASFRRARRRWRQRVNTAFDRLYEFPEHPLSAPFQSGKMLHQMIRSAYSMRDQPEMMQYASQPTWRLLFTALAFIGETKSQLFQDIWVLIETGFKRDGFFVDIGAYDGVSLSNSHLLEKSFGWRGILVEPNPIHADTLANARSARLCTKCVHASSGKMVEFWATEEPAFSGVAEHAGNEMHAIRRARHASLMIETISLTDLLGKFDSPTVVNYLSIDTEGGEYEILAAFDFERYDVRLISVEHNNGPNRDRIDILLRAKGYVRRMAEVSSFESWYAKSAAMGE